MDWIVFYKTFSVIRKVLWRFGVLALWSLFSVMPVRVSLQVKL